MYMGYLYIHIYAHPPIAIPAHPYNASTTDTRITHYTQLERQTERERVTHKHTHVISRNIVLILIPVGYGRPSDGPTTPNRPPAGSVCVWGGRGRGRYKEMKMCEYINEISNWIIYLHVHQD